MTSIRLRQRWALAALLLALIAPRVDTAALGQSAATPPQRQTADPAPLTRHDLRVTLDPATHRLSVAAAVTLSAAGSHPTEFLLNSRLSISRSSPALVEVPLGDVTRFFGINGAPPGLPLKRYRLRNAPSDGRLSLEYAGAMDFALSDQKEEYTRGFRETAGTISDKGVYLAGGSFWYPQFGEPLLAFTIEIHAPAGWHVISQGSGTSRDAAGVARWSSPDPMDEIYLVGGPLLVTRDRAGSVETLVYLHDKDEALAAKYLGVTSQYLEMYNRLIGPYPYDKFALVENFWETGYGMPSFTLLGPEVIRFPFILHSSYPHEILHNWWGNSVFVDYGSGNWAEGLTSYLADHLVQEQRRRASDYRRATLQKYRDYVREGRDFALTEFRSRDSAATEAVGYGKTMMTFHMMRRQLGDRAFQRMLAQLYRDYRGRRASWADVQRVAESVASATLAPFFDEWTRRPGAPVLAVTLDVVREGPGGWVVSGTLRQTQDGQPYALKVPVVVQTAAGVEPVIVETRGASTAFNIATKARPQALHVDPYFDLFRKLDPRETPPSIGQVFGEPRVLAVLPSKAPAAMRAGYRELLEGWQTPSHAIEIRLDSEVAQLPAQATAWLLGRENLLASRVFGAQAGVTIGADALTIDGQPLPFAKHTAVMMTRHPATPDKTVGWIVADPIEALPGLGRKLPHYGKYSYVGFEGTEPANTISGEWRNADSPLRLDLGPAAERSGAIASLPPDPARALAELPPAFSQSRMTDTVARLTAPELEGRGIGRKGLSVAAQWIAERFKEYGLAPGGDRGTYFQSFTVPKGPDGKPHEVTNVIAYLAGSRADWKTQSALLTAHYDHLGLGWPDVHAGDEGKVHPGADDNASGVAVLLELARAFATSEKPQRNVVFVAFAGEEGGLLGSRHFVERPSPFPLDGIIGVINVDTVGRLGDQRVSVLGTGTAAEWQHIFRGAGFVTGVEGRNIPESVQSSDQVPFVERGIPAVQIFTGAHGDYHRPGDTADKIDGPGLVKVAAFVREGIAYLAERPEKMTVTIASAKPGQGAAPPQGGAQAGARRVSFGTVPDFGFAGPGVRAESVVEGSPAARAGVAAGDVILKIDDTDIADLQAFSNVLRTLSAGQTVSVVLRRGDKDVAIKVTLAER